MSQMLFDYVTLQDSFTVPDVPIQTFAAMKKPCEFVSCDTMHISMKSLIFKRPHALLYMELFEAK